jgi:hypothetical protein
MVNGIVKIRKELSKSTSNTVFPQASGVMLLVVSWMDCTYYRLDWQMAFTQALSKMKFHHYAFLRTFTNMMGHPRMSVVGEIQRFWIDCFLTNGLVTVVEVCGIGLPGC